MTGVGAVFELYESWTDKRDKKKKAKSERQLQANLAAQEAEDDQSGSTQQKQQKKEEPQIGYRIEDRLAAFQEHKRRQRQLELHQSAGGSTGRPPTKLQSLASTDDEYIDEAVFYHACIRNNDWDGLWELLLNYDFQHYQEEHKKHQEIVKKATAAAAAKPKRRLRIVRGAINVKNYLLPEKDDDDDPDLLINDPTRPISPLLGCDAIGRTSLHSLCAIREVGDRILLRTLQSEKMAAQVRDDYGQLPLHIATKSGKSIKVIDKLMRANIPGIAQEDASSRTALWYCIQRTILTAEYGMEHHEEIPAVRPVDDIDQLGLEHDSGHDAMPIAHASIVDASMVSDDSLFGGSRSTYHDNSNHNGNDNGNAHDDATVITATHGRSFRGDSSMRDFTSRSTRSYYRNQDDFVEKEDGTTHYSTVADAVVTAIDEDDDNAGHGHDDDAAGLGKSMASIISNVGQVNDPRAHLMMQSMSLRSTRTAITTKSSASVPESSSKLLTSKIHKIKFTSITNDPYAKTTWGIPRTQDQIQWQELQENHWKKVRFMLSAYSARRKIFKPSERELLLWVIDHAAPPSVIEVALFASQKLLQTDPTLASAALHLFMRRQYPIKNLHLLLHHFPVQNKETMEAARRLLTKYYTSGCQLADDDTIPTFRKEMEQKALGNRKPSLACAEWWDKCTALMKLCGHENVETNKTKFRKVHLLHAALSNPETPPSLIQLCMVLSPKSLALPHPANNALLIHLICKSWRYNLFPHSKGLGIDFPIDPEPPMDQVVRIILASDPSLTRNRYEKRLPLHHAIASYKTWDFLQSLTQIDRLTLSQRDPITKLYPFQLAATLITNENNNNSLFPTNAVVINRNAALWAHARHSQEWTHMTPRQRAIAVQSIVEKQELEQFSITYQLLRIFPQAIASGASLAQPSAFRDATGRGMVSAHYLQFCYRHMVPDVIGVEDEDDDDEEEGEGEVDADGDNEDKAKAKTKGKGKKGNDDEDGSNADPDSDDDSSVDDKKKKKSKKKDKKKKKNKQKEKEKEKKKKKRGKKEKKGKAQQTQDEDGEEEKVEIGEDQRMAISEHQSDDDATGISTMHSRMNDYSYTMEDDATESKKTMVSSMNQSFASRSFVVRGDLIMTEDEIEDWVLIPQNYDLIRHAIDTRAIPPQLGPWWERCKFWIWYCTPTNSSEIAKSPKDSLLLHAALANEDTPPIIIQLILAIHPLSASLPSFGVHGAFEYPLHIAARTPTYVAQDFEELSSASALQMVLEAFPEAAFVENAQGLPIQVATAAGKTWYEMQALVRVTNQNPDVSKRADNLMVGAQQPNQRGAGGSAAAGHVAQAPSASMARASTNANSARAQGMAGNTAPPQQQQQHQSDPRLVAAMPPVVDEVEAEPPAFDLGLTQPSTSQAWSDLRKNLTSFDLTGSCGVGDASDAIAESFDEVEYEYNDGGGSNDGGGNGSMPYSQQQFQTTEPMSTRTPSDNLLGPMSNHTADDFAFASTGSSDDDSYSARYDADAASFDTDTSSWRSMSQNEGAGRWHQSASSANMSTYSSASSTQDFARQNLDTTNINAAAWDISTIPDIQELSGPAPSPQDEPAMRRPTSKNRVRRKQV